MTLLDTNYPAELQAGSRLAQVLSAIDEANGADPREETLNGEKLPKELAYGRKMSEWLFRLNPAPSELAQIACRAQHIERWKIARDEYPNGRSGYYRWRQACGRFHGEQAAALMAASGYSQEDCDAIQAILAKKHIKQSNDTQLMEDAACLVFLERYLEPFYQQHTDYDMEKWARIIKRTWDKMSDNAHRLALQMLGDLPGHLQDLLKKSLSG